MTQTPLEWSDNFSADILSVDKQHQELLYLTQKLLDVLSDDTACLEDKQTAFKDLVDHATAHFDYEERIMKNIGYPGLDEHRAEHQDLRDEISKITEAVMRGEGLEDWKGLVSLVQVWLLRHIVSSDTKIRKFVQSAGEE